MTVPAATAEAPPTGRLAPAWISRAHTSGWLLLLPSLIVLVILFVVPLVNVVVESFTEPSVGLGNYASLFTDGYTIRVLGRTLLVALVVCVAGALLAYPYAYAM